MKKKLNEWLKRYLPAEILGTITAILGAGLIFIFTKDRVLSAYAGVIGENIGYYGITFLREHIHDLKNSRKLGKKHGVKGLFKTTRNLIVEFGFAELLDSLIIRPFCMYIFPLIIGQFAAGIFIGKIIADFIFYLFAIVMYELRKKHLR